MPGSSRTTLAVALFWLTTPALAADVLVTDFTDDPKAPAAGSFRAAVAAAQSGDVIVFDQPLLIPLAGDLDLHAAGVTVRGRAGLQRSTALPANKLPVLRVRGSGVVLEDLELRDVVVSAQPSPAIGRLTGFTVRNCDFHGRGQLALARCDGAVVEDVTMTIDNSGGRNHASLAAILDLGGVGTRIERFDVSSVKGLALSAVEATGLVVRDGRMDGDARVVPGLTRLASAGAFQPGEIVVEQVDFTTRRLDVVPARSRPTGAVRVMDCSAGRMRVSGAKAEVLRNTVGLPAQDPLYAVGEVLLATNANLPGAMLVQGNSVRGGSRGLEVEFAHGSATCTVEGNIVEDASNVGIGLAIGDAAVVSGNAVSGGLTLGVKTGISVGGDSLSMQVTGNTVHDTGGQGIRIVQDVPGIVLRDNTVRDNDAAGIYVQMKGRAEIIGGVVERCGRSADPFGGGDSGIVFAAGASGVVEDTTLRDNTGAGVYVWKSAAVRLSRLACSGNGGPGIDVERRGVGFLTSKRTAPPFPQEVAFDESQHAVTGTSFPGALIQAYMVEDGARLGNAGFGEGATYLAEAVAAADGKFSVPVQCSIGDLVTVTVTRVGARAATSEFAQDVECKGAPIEVVSVSSAGVAGDARSGTNLRAAYGTRPAIGGEGRWVVFESEAGNLTADARDPGEVHVFLRDTESGTTTRLTPAGVTPGATLNGLVGMNPSVSEDGRWIAYVTASDEVIPGAQGGNYPYTVLFDAQSGATVAVSDPIPRASDDPYPSGQYTNFGGDDASISGDGSVVAFVSIGRDWVPGLADASFDKDLFVWTRATGAVEWVSVPTGGGDVPSTTFFGPQHPRLSFDGRYVAFATNQDLTGTGSAPGGAVFVRDRTSGTTEAVSLTTAGIPRAGETPQISSDGRYVVFATTSALESSDTNGRLDVYLRDRQLGTTERVSRRADGSDFPTRCSIPTMSADGRFVAFETVGQYVVPDGPTILGVTEIWLVDRQEHTAVEVSGGPNGEAFGDSAAPVLSRDGRSLLFQSFASNLVPEVTGDVVRLQVYLRGL